MKTENTPINYFDILKPDPLNKENHLLELKIKGGYLELAYSVKSLIAVCQSALMSQEDKNECHTSLDLINVLELANQMIPLSEAEYLDKMHGMFKNKAE